MKAISVIVYLGFLITWLVGFPGPLYAQGTNSNFRQFAFNPYLFNPAYAAMAGRSELNIGLRKQWLDFRDAPMTGSMNLQLPVSSRMVVGGNFLSQSQVMINSSVIDASLTYIVPLTARQEIRLGLAGGVGMNRLALTANEMNTVDPVIANAAGTSFFPDGSFGTVYSAGRFHAGFALTNIFNNTPMSPARFEGFKFSNFRNRLYSIGYRWDLRGDGQLEIEPYALYRQYTSSSQNSWEVASIVHFWQLLSLGASYNQVRGPGFFLGINVGESLRIGYSYESATFGNFHTNTNAHEVQLGLRFGRRPAKPSVLSKTRTRETSPGRQEPPRPPQPVKKQEVDSVEIVENKKQQVVEEKPLRYFVVAGVFADPGNAKVFGRELTKHGHFADIFLRPSNGKYYVYVFVSRDIEEARKIRGIYRERIPDLKAWILVHE